MPSLNYKHLRYFWMVAKSGSIARASEQLHLTPQSISGQLGEFEETLGVELFRRVGRGLELTETGQRLLGYAEQIFALGDEMLDSIRDAAQSPSVPFRVGIADSVPKMVAYRLVEPSLGRAEPIRLVCREGRLTALLADLAIHRLDMVIADRPMPENLNVRGYDHFLGESGVSVFGAGPLVERCPGGFPALLDGAPFLLPGVDVALHARLMRWFESQRLHPRIVGEFDDSALMKTFGAGGAGVFVAPSAIAAEITRQHEVRVVGTTGTVHAKFYALSMERRIRHPAVARLVEAARAGLFGAPPAAGAPP